MIESAGYNGALLTSEVTCSSCLTADNEVRVMNEDKPSYNTHFISKLLTYRFCVFADECSLWIQQENERVVFLFRIRTKC